MGGAELTHAVHEFAERQRLEGYRQALADCDDALRERGASAFRSWLEARCLEANALISRRADA